MKSMPYSTKPAPTPSPWQDDWKSALVTNSSLVDDPAIRQTRFDLPRLQRLSVINRSHCGSCQKKWGLAMTDKCPYGERQNRCPQPKR